ncbi:MAG: hypothetical protein KGO96_10630 [Elusimicrobia bacterium]|nr:hypothetical protein [Elusimicrobiota bacterium]
MPAALTLTQDQELNAVATFITGALGSDVEVVIGQTNRVAEPASADYVVMWPVSRMRLGTNVVMYQDTSFVGSISNGVLSLVEFVREALPLVKGTQLTDVGGLVTPGTLIVNQLSGPTGGVGNYQVSPVQNVTETTIYAGVRSDLAAFELVVQADVHGPNSGDNSTILQALLRSEYGTDAFSASGADVSPLHCDDAKQIPFINAENQYEDRWVLEMHLQVNPTVMTWQQFAASIKINLVQAGAVGPI